MISNEKIKEAIEYAIKTGEVDTLEQALSHLSGDDREETCHDLIKRVDVMKEHDILKYLLFETDVIFDEETLDEAEDTAEDVSLPVVRLIQKYRTAY